MLLLLLLLSFLDLLFDVALSSALLILQVVILDNIQEVVVARVLHPLVEIVQPLSAGSAGILAFTLSTCSCSWLVGSDRPLPFLSILNFLDVN